MEKEPMEIRGKQWKTNRKHHMKTANTWEYSSSQVLCLKFPPQSLAVGLEGAGGWCLDCQIDGVGPSAVLMFVHDVLEVEDPFMAEKF